MQTTVSASCSATRAFVRVRISAWGRGRLRDCQGSCSRPGYLHPLGLTHSWCMQKTTFSATWWIYRYISLHLACTATHVPITHCH